MHPTKSTSNGIQHIAPKESCRLSRAHTLPNAKARQRKHVTYSHSAAAGHREKQLAFTASHEHSATSFWKADFPLSNLEV
jgi:hypothetical protein